MALLLALLLPSPHRAIAGLDRGARPAPAPRVCPLYKRYLDERMSTLLRNNVIIRSQAEGAREAERQRIAADFHDGPLQSFISFQMRLEIVKKLMARDQPRPRKRSCASCRNCAAARWPSCAVSCAACVRRMKA